MLLIPSIRLEAVLGGAVATSQPEFHVDYMDVNLAGVETKELMVRGALNSTTDVVLLAAPEQAFVRRITRMTIYNKDTASVLVTVKTDDGTTERIYLKQTLATLESLHWERNSGWQVAGP